MFSGLIFGKIKENFRNVRKSVFQLCDDHDEFFFMKNLPPVHIHQSKGISINALTAAGKFKDFFIGENLREKRMTVIDVWTLNLK